MQLATVRSSDSEASVVLRGVSPTSLRRRAADECDRALGAGDWQFVRADVVPCMVSPGGRTRLYEGRFVAHHN